MKLEGIARTLLVLTLTACGGGSDAVTDGEEEPLTSGGEGAGSDEGDDELDPCAGSDSGCAEGEDAEGAEGAEDGEGEDPDGEGSEAEGAEGGDPEARGGVGEDGGAPDPQEEWRAMLRRGRTWFIRRCDTCHPGGEEDIGPNLRGIRWAVPRMTRQIRRGGGRMRPIGPGRLPEEHMDALMAYMSRMGIVRGVQRPE